MPEGEKPIADAVTAVARKDTCRGIVHYNRDAIWVIVDHLTKTAHFLPIRTTDKIEDLAREYLSTIVKLQGVPVSIVSDRDPKFTSTFWQAFLKELGTKVRLSTAYHPQTNGQSERTIQTFEDMLRSSVLEWGGGVNGASFYHWWSSLITTATMRALK